MTRELTVYEISEDSDSWVVSGVLGNAEQVEDEARAAIDAWLVERLGDDAEALAVARENLAAAKPRTGTWWFATGHREGELVKYRETQPPKAFYGVVFQ